MNDIQCYLNARRAAKKAEEAKKPEKEFDVFDFIRAGGTAEEWREYAREQRSLGKDIW